MPPDSIEQLARDFRDLSDFLHAGGAASTARQRLVDLATSSIDGCDWAGITVRPEDRPAYSLTRLDDVVREVDECQYEFGEGPCLDAARTHEPVLSRDLAHETRWPRFTEHVLQHSPVRGALSFHLLDDPSPTALNLYSASSDGLDDEAVATASLFAIHASVMIAHADSADRAATLGAALTTSRQIGAAVGILMALHRISESEAYDLLRLASNHLNRKLRDIARDVTESGALPTKDDA
ncbi:GAF and ANTAR domain-containing protein [Brachybacterium sp. NPDC056505]|uniref:GAF and ANTAR domain-containing protein n=1 Tax=Brachybacterium sp. NPDC056505 TaxID=3345843 RepID=UPI0036707C57